MTPYALNSQTRNAEHNKARMTNPVIITKYFHDLGEIIRNLGLESKPSCIWNFDETGKSFEHQPVRIIAEKGFNTVVGRTSSCRTNITVMACVNAAGSKMSPLLIVKGKTGFNTFAATEYSNKLHKHDALLFFRVYFGSFVRSNLCFCFTSLHVCSM